MRWSPIQSKGHTCCGVGNAHKMITYLIQYTVGGKKAKHLSAEMLILGGDMIFFVEVPNIG